MQRQHATGQQRALAGLVELDGVQIQRRAKRIGQIEHDLVKTLGARFDQPTGVAQAQFNLATLDRVGLKSDFMWVDVEPYPVAPWTSNRKNNKAVLDGVLRGYRDAGLDVGFYTSPGPWRDIIGTARYGLPEWRTAGGHPWSRTDYGSARKMCRVTSVQGGPILLAQGWDTKRDYDLLCPAARTAARLDSLFINPQELP